VSAARTFAGKRWKQERLANARLPQKLAFLFNTLGLLITEAIAFGGRFD
jgi:hypothetical protein